MTATAQKSLRISFPFSSFPRPLIGDDVGRGHTVEGDSRQRIWVAGRISPPADSLDCAIECEPVGIGQRATRGCYRPLVGFSRITVNDGRLASLTSGEKKSREDRGAPHSS
jgi:hypothetical protein